MFFASDNTSGVPAEIMAALTRANEGYARSYGADDIMARVTARIRSLFDAPEAAVHLVATGTAANALALATLTPPWGAIFCHRHAHIAEDECGAPEFFAGGAKLALIDGPHGKITPAALTEALATTGASGVHGVQRGALSLTNVTEAGTTYTPAEIAALTAIAKTHNLPCHLDGARFANAVAALNVAPKDITWKAGVDVLCCGGTKLGMAVTEAVVFFNRLSRAAGNVDERRFANRGQAVPATVNHVEDVQVGTVFEDHRVELVVEFREALGVEVLQALPHLDVDRARQHEIAGGHVRCGHRRRHRPQSGNADRRDDPADPRRDAHRRHAAFQAPAPAPD